MGAPFEGGPGRCKRCAASACVKNQGLRAALIDARGIFLPLLASSSVTDLFVVPARLETGAIRDAIPPSVLRPFDPVPVPHRDGDDVILDFGPWTPRAPARHLLPSFAALVPRPPAVRFELSGRRGDAWSPWVTTVTLGDAAFSALPAFADGITVDVDEITATPPLDAVRLRIRVQRSDADALNVAPWLATMSAWDGSAPASGHDAGFAGQGATARLRVPPRTQMNEPAAVRLHVCSPTSVGMALAFHGCDVPTMTLAEEIFHRETNRYGIWPAAVRAAAAHGVPGYLLRFPDWDTAAWCLSHGLPIVASIGYADGELANAPVPQTTGHLIVITGLDGNDVLVNDPAAPTAAEVPRRYRRADMTRAWLERNGVGYVFLPRLEVR